MDILDKKAYARNGKCLFLIIALDLVDQRTAAQIEAVFRNLAFIKKRNKLIIFQLILLLNACVIGNSAKNHKRNQNIRQYC